MFCEVNEAKQWRNTCDSVSSSSFTTPFQCCLESLVFDVQPNQRLERDFLTGYPVYDASFQPHKR